MTGENIGTKVESIINSTCALPSFELTGEWFSKLWSVIGCSLLFMIAGLYLRQITKLKVGAFELEKSTIDQNPTSSLGVDKNSFNKAPRFHNHMLGKQGPDDK